jgi:membrane-associated phospholipid phosphatase
MRWRVARARLLFLILILGLNSLLKAQDESRSKAPGAPDQAQAGAQSASTADADKNSAEPDADKNKNKDKDKNKSKDDKSKSARESESENEERFLLQPGEDPENRLFLPFVKHLATDQEQFWTTPVRLRMKDLKWIAPFAGVTAGLIASDSWLSRQIPDDPSQLKRSRDISNYTLYSLAAVSGGSFLLGQVTHDDHLRESGMLSGEAAINSTAVAFLLKAITERPRPLADSGHGTFFRGGASFPSEQSAAAWSIASVWAHEYPGTLSQILAYGMATGVTVTRLTAKQHFASDAVIGSVLGWYFGRQAYRAHHDPELGGTSWGSPLPDQPRDKTRNPDNMGSPYVPLDSWVYPAFDRLIALGYIRSAYLGIRPWTRMECARLLEDAEDRLSNEDSDSGEAGGQSIYSELTAEFAVETARRDGAANVGATLESIYERSTEIAGPPLRDGYHFGETLTNDFGRPYAQGFNAVAGITAHAEFGPLSFYIRGEYQHAPAAASDPPGVLEATANADLLCLAASGARPGCATVPLSELNNATAQIDRFRLLDSAVTLNLYNVQFSFGKQSEWLGPGQTGPLLLSDNAAPIPMFRIDNVSPFYFPLLSRLLGPVRMDFFVGQLSGQRWEFDPPRPTLVGPGFHPQPFIHENKISFKPTENLEFGMGVTAIFGGPGLPFTWSEFVRSYYVHKQSIEAGNPAKRFSEFDFSYRIPGLRKWLTVYNDSLVGDEYSPIGSSRPLLNPGIYLPHVPKIAKMDLRVEGLKEPFEAGHGALPGFPYFDLRYRSGYTNDGSPLGTWIGRAGFGGQAWATYWLSARNKLQVSYRHQEVNSKFVVNAEGAGGGHANDFSAQCDFKLGPEVNFTGVVQYEQWNFPVLRSTAQSDVTASVQLTFHPNLQFHK